MTLIDIGGGFPAPYDEGVRPFHELARRINSEIDRLFPKDIEILAEPGRFLIATAATVVAKVVGKAQRDGKRCYYINDGVYHTYSGIIFDHCKYPVKAIKERPDGDFAPSSARLATRSTRFRWPKNCPTWSWAIWSIARTSAPTATPPRPTSTASRRPRCCISIGRTDFQSVGELD